MKLKSICARNNTIASKFSVCSPKKVYL